MTKHYRTYYGNVGRVRRFYSAIWVPFSLVAENKLLGMLTQFWYADGHVLLCKHLPRPKVQVDLQFPI